MANKRGEAMLIEKSANVYHYCEDFLILFVINPSSIQGELILLE